MSFGSKLTKEIPDQAGHFTWAALTVLLLVMGWRQLGQSTIAALAMIAGGLTSLSILMAREIAQKVDQPRGILGNWPILDSIFYGLGGAGMAVGLWLWL